MKPTTFLLVIGILSFSAKSYGQSDKELLIAGINSFIDPATKNYMEGDYDSCISFCNMAVKRIDDYKKNFGKDTDYYLLHHLAYIQLGNSYFKKSDFNQSSKYYNEGLQEQTTSAKPVKINRFYFGIGRNYESKGNLDYAQGYMDKAIQTIDTTDLQDYINKGTYLNQLANIYEKKGDPIKHLTCLKKCVNLNKTLLNTLSNDKPAMYFGAVRGLVTANNNMAKILIRQGKFEEAKKISLESLNYYTDHPQKEQYYFTYDNLMEIYLNLGEMEEAKKYMEKAVQINDFPPYSLMANMTKARFYNASNDALKSNEVYYDVINEIKADGQMAYMLPEYLDGSARNFLAEKQYQKALNNYEEAIALLSLSRADKFSLTSIEADAYTGAIYSCIRLSDYAKAYNYVLAFKSYNLNSLLVSLNKEGYDMRPEKTKNDEIQKKLTLINRSNSSFKEKEIECRLLISEFNDNMSAIRKDYKAVEVKDILKTIGHNEILLDFFAVNEIVFCFVVEEDGITAFELGYKNDLDKLINSFQSDFINPSQKYFYQGAIRYGKIAKEQFPKVSHDLYSFLIAPIAKRVEFKDKKLVIMPSGDISKIPFELLIPDSTPKEFTDYNYLFQTTDINYYPSAITFYLSRQQKNDAKTFEHQFLGIGDPLFAEHPFISNYKLNTKGSYVPVSSDNTVNGKNEAKLEISEITKLFSSSEIALERENATEIKFKSINPATYKYIHFSTHGFVNTDIPELSYLKLTEDKDQREDGNLSALELLPLNLNTELIVLSACESGLGKVDKREGMTGFSNYLLVAGAKSAILSLWPVADKPTSVFFTKFYKSLVNESKDKLESLKMARREFINNTEFAHPFLWAPFILYGSR